ncbi:unnamed protein product [Peronospora farinosa]|uniref:Uncharacterized protein n=1 Tax=Peronospora farinosa TaxID=134698 RepID=A0AAV0UYP1_9STRA|nr:unnamed protein product [Peronospora farinosa]
MQGLRGEESEIIEGSVTEVITETPFRTPTEMSQLRILKKNPPPILAEPQLMGLLQRERSHLLGLIAPSQTERQPLVKLIQPIDTAFRAVDDMAGQLQLRAVTTPATGNCMAMAIVQALRDTDLAAQDTQLAAATETFTSLPRVGKVVMTGTAACTGRVP